jgi:hypothetical protein
MVGARTGAKATNLEGGAGFGGTSGFGLACKTMALENDAWLGGPAGGGALGLGATMGGLAMGGGGGGARKTVTFSAARGAGGTWRTTDLAAGI